MQLFERSYVYCQVCWPDFRSMVPIVVDRLTRSRQNLPPSYHGYPDDEKRSDFIVHTEYGADLWKQVMQAGFSECRIIALEYPAAIALVAIKSH